MDYQIEYWQDAIKKTRTSKWKQVIYSIYRPVNSQLLKHYLGREFRKTHKPEFLFCKRGFPLEKRKVWATNNGVIKDKTLLIQGTGTGWDIVGWAQLYPRKIYAVDLFSFKESWDDIIIYCKQKFNVEVEFFQSRLENLDFLENGSIDLCTSDAVFEHCQDLAAVIKESFRVLSENGFLYASYGPMWYCAGGDHFSGKNSLFESYNHITLEEEEYRLYVESRRSKEENFQSGYRYFQIGLFSYLTTQSYLNIFKSNGFAIDSLCVELSSKALKFKQKFPTEFESIVRKNKDKCTQDDMLIKGNLIRLKKNPISK